VTKHSPTHPPSLLASLTIIVLAGTAVMRYWLTTDLALFGDEAFYWLESQHPDWGYSDVPLLTPWLVGLGSTWLEGYHGVRLLFVALGSLIPVAVWWLARAITGDRHALISALACLAVPLLAGMGVLALPDVPLVLASTLVLGMAVRCEQQPASRAHWVILGGLMAVGFLAHYRFVLLPLALLLASLSHPATRRLWRTANPWISCGIAMSGVLPTLWFNLQQDYAAIGFHFNQRHPWQFQVEGLMYPVMQAIVISPLMLLALLAAGLPLWRACQQGQAGARLLAMTSLLYLGVFGLLAPWTDQRSTNIHWPLTGYIPLLVFLPLLFLPADSDHRRTQRTWLGILVLGSGLATSLLGGWWLHSMHRLDSLPYPIQRHITANMAGWKDIATRVAPFRDQVFVTDNYYLAAQLAFELRRTEGILTFDHDKAVRDGRIRQLALWGWLLQDRWPDTAIAVIEHSRYNAEEWPSIVDTLCLRYPHLRTLEHFEQFQGKRDIVVLSLDDHGHTSHFCEPLIEGWVDSVKQQQQQWQWRGWYSHPSGIDNVSLLLDGNPVATAHYGIERADVSQAMGKHASPEMPFVGFTLSWDSRDTTPGWHRLQLLATSRSGKQAIQWEQWFEQEPH